MGILNTINATLRRLHILALPENGILENAEEVIMLLECVFQRLRLPLFHQRNSFPSNENISLLFTVLERAKGDLQITKEIFQVFVLLLKCEETRVESSQHSCALAMHHSGKLEFLESVFDLHRAGEEDVRAHEQIIRKALMASSARSSLHEISKIKRAMDLGITLDIFQQAQETFYTSSQGQQRTLWESKDRQLSDGVADITLVLAHMEKHPTRNEVVTAGLEVVVKHTRNDQNAMTIDFFLSEPFIEIIKAALSHDSFQQQMAMTILLALTSESRFCHFFGIQRGCDTLMKVLLNADLNLADGLHQLALWILSNLSNEGSSRMKLEESGLKVYLNELSEAFIPLQLRLLYGDDELRDAKRFHISSTSDNPEEEDSNRAQTNSLVHVLPRSKKRLYPSHGTTQDLFQNGYPGLL